jgi:two-component sensor histidine kinase
MPYHRGMIMSPMHTASRRNALLTGLRRVRFTLLLCLVFSLPLLPSWTRPLALLSRAGLLGLATLAAFSLLERWPKRLPPWLARWAWQVAGVALVVPITTLAIYVFSRPAGDPAFWQVADRLRGFTTLTVMGLLLAPWVALAALVRQKDALARHQALAFQLARSELERQALDARLSLMQAQVAPHFLFNTLANIQALVDVGSPQASSVLRSLTDYLRAAVPRLGQTETTLGDELALVNAYLTLMHMRMPDRLQFTVQVEDGLRPHPCPPMSLLTLVENAVKHGIDPSEEGGRIDIVVSSRDGRCVIEVRDTGVGLRRATQGSGTGLATLRERLRLRYGNDWQLDLGTVQPHGLCAVLVFPLAGAST